MTHTSFSDRAPTVEGRPGSRSKQATPQVRSVPALRQAPGDGKVAAAAHGAGTAPITMRKPRPTRRSKSLLRACSFIGGLLVGIALSLPMFALGAEEGGGALVLVGIVTLAAVGVGMHLVARRNR